MGRFVRCAPTLALLLLAVSAFSTAEAQKSSRKPTASARRPAVAARASGSRTVAARSTARPVARKTATSGARVASKRGTVVSRRASARMRRPPAPPLPTLDARFPFGVDGLRTDLGYLADSSIRSGSWGVMVASLSYGDTLFSINADVPHQPASTQKLLTSVLALSGLGPQYRYRTDILHTGSFKDGRIDGDLVLRGDGDPSLSSRFFGRSPDAAMDSLVAGVARAGVREVTGRVIGDASAFEPRNTPEGWHPRILQDGYAGKVSGLSLNENIVWVTIRPTTRGAAAEVVLEPATTAIPLMATVRTVRGAGAPLRMSRTSAGITVVGSIGELSAPRSYSYIVEDPSSFTTGAFLAALQRNGITVGKGMLMARTPASAERLTTWESAPLETLLTVMNRESNNVLAEHIFRAASRGTDRQITGAAFAADTAVRGLLVRSAGIRGNAVRSADGSGLSQLDAISPRAMVQLLGWADREQWGQLLHASLPLAGESGTLRRRMTGTSAQTNLHAKTGTTNEIIALSGYVTARNGELLAFAIMYNGRDLWRAREAVDAMGVTLANWSR